MPWKFAALHREEIEVISAGAKGKLKLGGPVVSRHVKVKSYNLTKDDQQILDNDFLVAPG